MFDLSDDLSLTNELLADTWAWRHRLVEDVELGSSDQYLIRRSFQLELGRDLLEARLGGADDSSVRVLVPLGTMPKQPLLDFDLLGPGGVPAALETRRSGALVQAGYLAALATGDEMRQGLLDQAFPERVLEAICAFTPAYFEEVTRTTTVDQALAAYVGDGLGFEISGRTMRHLRRLTDRVSGIVSHALGEPPNASSSSENPLLAMPLVDPRPSSEDEVVHLVRAYFEGVTIAQAEGARGFLSALAEYGRSWELLTELELPVGTPALVKMVERRQLETKRRRGCRSIMNVRFDTALGEAQSYHLSVRVGDDALRLAGGRLVPRWRDPDEGGPPLASALIEGVRDTPELFTLYTSASNRPTSARFEIDVKPAAEVSWLGWGVSALCLLTLVGVIVGDDAPDRLGVLAVPTTFAVAILQVRERVSLLSRLQRPRNVATATMLALVWIVVVVRLGGST